MDKILTLQSNKMDIFGAVIGSVLEVVERRDYRGKRVRLEGGNKSAKCRDTRYQRWVSDSGSAGACRDRACGKWLTVASSIVLRPGR
jgi:hypothetical protein